MKKLLYMLVVTSVLGLVIGCNSDSDSLTSEETEIKELLNNEWEAIEWSQYEMHVSYTPDIPLTTEEIELIMDRSDVAPFREPYVISLGLNKKGELYYIHKHAQQEYPIDNPVIDLLYVATTQKDNVFTGCFNYLTEPDKSVRNGSFYIRKMDENTIKVMFTLAERTNGKGEISYSYRVLVMKKKGMWDEHTTVKKLLERYNFEPNFIEMMGGDHYEKEVAVKNCQ